MKYLHFRAFGVANGSKDDTEILKIERIQQPVSYDKSSVLDLTVDLTTQALGASWSISWLAGAQAPGSQLG